MDTPRFSASLSTSADSARAEREATDALLAGMAGETPDLLLAFATHHHGSALERLGPRLAASSGAAAVLGCTGESVIGGAREIEHEPALALFAARLPGCAVRCFETDAAPAPEETATFTGFPDVREPARASVLVLAEPFTFPADHFLRALEERWPGVPVTGGMASGGSGPGQNLLITRDGLRESGAIGAVIEGGIELCSVVSQGCRPVGNPVVITACEHNEVQKLGGRPALDVLMETLHALPAADQKLFQGGPFLGLAIDATKPTFERGDFLVRGIVRVDPKQHSFAVAELVRRGQTAQFLVRDAASAGEDLRLLLRSRGGADIAALGGAARAGALLFSCNGRGSRLFSTPDHDVTALRAGLACDLPVAGFFCAGEIGPVGGRNFVHGFTASVAILRPRV